MIRSSTVIITILICISLLAPPVLAVEQLEITGQLVPAGGTSSDQTNIIKGNISNIQQSRTSDGSFSILPSDNSLTEQLRIIGFRFSGQPVDTAFNLQMNVPLLRQSDTLTSKAILYFRAGGEFDYQEFSLDSSYIADSGYKFSYEPYALKGIEYYLTLSNNLKTVQLGSAEHPLAIITSFDNLMGRSTGYLAPYQYHLISFPALISGSNDVTTVYSDDLGSYDPTVYRLGRYSATDNQTKEYPNLPNVEPGIGYWLIGSERLSVGTPGFSVRPNLNVNDQAYYRFPLDSGWNQIGNPFAFDISFDDLLFEHNGDIHTADQIIVEDSAYWYNGSRFRSTSTLFAWHGFFLFCHQAEVSVLFPYHVSTPAQPSPKEQVSPGLLIELSLRTNNGLDDGHYLGISNGELNDYRDLPVPPGQPDLAIIDHENPMIHWRGKYLRPEDKLVWNLRAELPSDGQLQIQAMHGLTPDMKIIVTDSTGQSLPLDSLFTIKLNTGVHFLTLSIISNTTSSDPNDLPVSFQLNQNYPNPFNSSTSISFDLPAPSFVTLGLFDLNGRKTTTLVNKILPAGYHVIKWDGMNSSGTACATGVYFYKLNAGQFESTRKMILLK